VLKYAGKDTDNKDKVLEPVMFSSGSENSKLVPGFKAAVYYFEEELTHMPDIETATPAHTVTADKLNFKSNMDFRLLAKDWPEESVMVDFSGIFIISAPGLYSFSCTSANGSHLWIDGNMVIDNGGMHGELEKRGSLKLSSGYHTIRVDFLKSKSNGDPALTVKYQGPDTQEIYSLMRAVHFADPGPPAVMPSLVEGQGWCSKWYFSPNGHDEIQSMPRFRKSIPQKVEVVSALDYQGLEAFKKVSEDSAERLAVSFSGEHVFEKNGMYKLCLTASNDAYLKLDGQSAVRLKTKDGEVRTKCKERYMSEKRYMLTVEFYENGRNPEIKLTYSGKETDGEERILPSSGYNKETCELELPTCECGEGWCSSWFFNAKMESLADSLAIRSAVSIHPQYARRLGELDFESPSDFKRLVRGVDSVPNSVVTFSGYVYISKEGTYTICIQSSAGSIVNLDGANILRTTESGKKCEAVTLQAGAHRTLVVFFYLGKADPSLILTYSGPDTGDKETGMKSSWHSDTTCGADPSMPTLIETPPDKAPAPVPPSPVKETPADLLLNYYCRQFLKAPASKQERYLRKCQAQDCQQAEERVGCHYMSAEGFCWVDSGQHFCAKPENKESEWCKTNVPEDIKLYEKCAGQGEMAQWERDLQHSEPQTEQGSVVLPDMPAEVNYFCNKYYKWVEKVRAVVLGFSWEGGRRRGGGVAML